MFTPSSPRQVKKCSLSLRSDSWFGKGIKSAVDGKWGQATSITEHQNENVRKKSDFQLPPTSHQADSQQQSITSKSYPQSHEAQQSPPTYDATVASTTNEQQIDHSACTNASEPLFSEEVSCQQISPDSRNIELESPLQASRFLDLPLEIQQIIYSHYFSSQCVMIRIQKRTDLSTPWIQNHWDDDLAFLLTCKYVYETTKPFIKLAETALDLRQYHTSSCAPLDFKVIAQMLKGVAFICTRMLVREKQFLQKLSSKTFPALKTVQYYDYKWFREQASRAHMPDLGHDFDTVVTRLCCLRFNLLLGELQPNLPRKTHTEVIFVCDCLICLDHNNILSRHLKLRHLVRFSTKDPDRGVIVKDWLGPGVLTGPCSFDDSIAPHIHDYCIKMER